MGAQSYKITKNRCSNKVIHFYRWQLAHDLSSVKKLPPIRGAWMDFFLFNRLMKQLEAKGKDEDGQDGLSETTGITLRTLFPSDTSTITLKRSNYFPLSTHKFQYCFAHISRLWKLFFRYQEDVEIDGARLKERGRHGWRKGGKNEKERLVFMPGSQRACKSPRSVVEDSRRLIVIHHSWQPHCSGRAWQHSPAWETGWDRREKKTKKKDK